MELFARQHFDVIVREAAANNAERCVYRGGGWDAGAHAGVFSLRGGDSRGYAGASLGFRAAYIPEIR